jgi:hypothetical protein
MGMWTPASFIGVFADVNDPPRKSVPMPCSFGQNLQSQSIFQSRPGKPDRSDYKAWVSLTVFAVGPSPPYGT